MELLTKKHNELQIIPKEVRITLNKNKIGVNKLKFFILFLITNCVVYCIGIYLPDLWKLVLYTLIPVVNLVIFFRLTFRRIRNRFLLFIVYGINIFLSAYIIFPLFNLYCFLLDNWTFFNSMLQPIIAFCTQLSQNNAANILPGLLVSASVILLFKDIIKWSESILVAEYNSFTVRQLRLQNHIIVMLIVTYSIFISYWVAGHKTYIVPFSILELFIIISQIILLNYPKWDQELIKRYTIKYIKFDALNSIQYFSLKYIDEYHFPAGLCINFQLLESCEKLIINIGRLYSAPTTYKKRIHQHGILQMLIAQMIGKYENEDEECNNSKVTELQYLLLSVGLGCAMQVTSCEEINSFYEDQPILLNLKNTLREFPKYKYYLLLGYCSGLLLLFQKSDTSKLIYLDNLIHLYNSIVSYRFNTMQDINIISIILLMLPKEIRVAFMGMASSRVKSPSDEEFEFLTSLVLRYVQAKGV